jgi:predicted nucleic acid-binding protein
LRLASHGWKRPESRSAATGLLIAAHAYATDATIVTANADEFKRIRGLKVENWLA